MSSFKEFIRLFQEVWVQGVFGINVSEIMIGLLIFLFFYILRKLFARLIIRRIARLVLKSDNQIDDTVINVIEGPIKFLPIVIGFFIASSFIKFTIDVQNFIDLINRSLITIFIFWLLYQLVIPFSFLIKKFETNKMFKLNCLSPTECFQLKILKPSACCTCMLSR